MSSRLDHFTMTVRDFDGGVEMSTGAIAVEGHAVTMGVPRLKGKGLRIYHKMGDRELTALGWMRRVESLAEILSRRPAGGHGADILVEVADSASTGGGRRGRRFAAIELKTRTVRRLDDASAADVDAVVRSWVSAASRDELLLELNDSLECLAELLREFGGSMSGADVPVTTDIREKPGDAVSAPSLPFDTPESASLRVELSRDWLDAEGVGRLLGSEAENVSHLPNKLRRQGRILGVWLLPEHRYRFPPWQFLHGRPIEELGEVLTLLRSDHGVARGRRTSGWEEIEWLCGPHALLEGRRPCDVLASDPQRVLRVARREFTEDVDARW